MAYNNLFSLSDDNAFSHCGRAVTDKEKDVVREKEAWQVLEV